MRDSLVSNGEKADKVRNSRNSWIPWGQETDWIYQKLTNFVIDCNNKVYNFDLNGFFEDIQFTEYKEGCFYNYHEDMSQGVTSIRKLSCVVQLDDEDSYQGGELCLFHGNEKHTASKKQGTVILFPSFIPHKVNKVISGERRSLVSWISGNPFR